MEEKILNILIDIKADIGGLKKGQDEIREDISWLKADVSEFKERAGNLETDMSEVKITVNALAGGLLETSFYLFPSPLAGEGRVRG